MHTCDGCGKKRSDLRACGDNDDIALCFICRKEGERRHIWDNELHKYVAYDDLIKDEIPF